jgi:uncharacterized protein DUF3515
MALAAIGVAAALTSACGGDSIEAAADGGSPACSALVARLPDSVLDRDRRSLDVAGAARWGDPAVVLRCGVPAPGPTTEHCMTVDDVDWVLVDDRHDFRFLTYGREPAVEVTVPAAVGRTNAPSALVDLDAAVKPIPAGRACIGADDA